VNCFVVEINPVLQFGRFARTAQVYDPEGRAPLVVHVDAVAGEAEQTGDPEDVGLPIPANTSYPVTPDAVDGLH
jgi:hypothetical protein